MIIYIFIITYDNIFIIIYEYIYIYIHIHIYIYIIYIYTYTYIYICININKYIYIYITITIWHYTIMCMYIYIHICVYIIIYNHIWLYMYIHINHTCLHKAYKLSYGFVTTQNDKCHSTGRAQATRNHHLAAWFSRLQISTSHFSVAARPEKYCSMTMDHGYPVVGVC